jgi:hypothetical protein
VVEEKVQENKSVGKKEGDSKSQQIKWTSITVWEWFKMKTMVRDFDLRLRLILVLDMVPFHDNSHIKGGHEIKYRK